LIYFGYQNPYSVNSPTLFLLLPGLWWCIRLESKSLGYGMEVDAIYLASSYSYH
jgi:hypothetical protein